MKSLMHKRVLKETSLKVKRQSTTIEQEMQQGRKIERRKGKKKDCEIFNSKIQILA